MSGQNLIVQVLSGMGQLAITLVLALVLYKIGNFVDALSEVIKKG